MKQAYWGAVTAKTIRAFLLEVRDQVDQAIARTERLVEGGYATDIDLYRFRSKRGELEQYINLADKTIDLATQALGTWTGQPKGVAVDPDRPGPAGGHEAHPVRGPVRPDRARRAGPSSPSSARASRRAGGWSRSSASRATRSSSSASWAISPTRPTATGSRTPTSSIPCTTPPSGRSSASSTTSTSGSAPERSRRPRRRSRSSRPCATTRSTASRSRSATRTPRWSRPSGTRRSCRRRTTTPSSGSSRAPRTRTWASGTRTTWRTPSSSTPGRRADYLQALYAYVFGLEQLAHAAGQDVRRGAAAGAAQAVRDSHPED